MIAVWEENKYYTPEIEEFHVGFEFEDYLWIDDKWQYTKKIYGGSLLRKDADMRVKYLDREDIESLGFEHDKEVTVINGGGCYKRGDFYIHLRIDGDALFPIDISYKSNHHKFLRIKNKSELKQVLKMIGV